MTHFQVVDGLVGMGMGWPPAHMALDRARDVGVNGEFVPPPNGSAIPLTQPAGLYFDRAGFRTR